MTVYGSIRTIAPLFLPLVTEKQMKTFSPTPEDVKHDWFLVDAKGKTLGRLSTEIARRLRGKHKPEYTPHMDMGDYIVVINAGEIQVTGNKTTDKIYYRHSGFPGGLKSTTFDKLRASKPEIIIEKAVKGMLPKGPLGRDMFRKLRVFPGAAHAHAAQQPTPLEI
ncbi:MAG: large subunit ribosomal protein L13 [Gammaproteobacteria bacterium]